MSVIPPAAYLRLLASPVVASCLLPLPAAAAQRAEHVSSSSQRIGRRRAGILLIHHRTAAVILTPNGDMSPGERAETAADRLQSALANGVGAGSVQAHGRRRSWRVVAGDSVLLQATRPEARAHGTTPSGLAHLWAGQIRRLLAMPAVSLAARALLIPLGESRTLPLGGWAESGWQARTAFGPGVAGVDVRGRSVVIKATGLGRAEVVVGAEGDSARCAVTVRKYAGRPGSAVTAEVTGSPAPPNLLSAAGAVAVDRFLPREPGASVRLLGAPVYPHELSPGRSSTCLAPVSIAGPGYIPIRGTARVTVRNVALTDRPAERLLYSNEPERIRREGTLFVGKVEAGGPSRLFYHHINDTRRPVLLTATVVNMSMEPVRLQIVPGFGAPDTDAVRAGHVAGQRFFPRYMHNAGEIYLLPSGAAIPLAVHRLDPQETASGMAEMRILSPDSAHCLLRVSAAAPRNAPWPASLAGVGPAWRHASPRPATTAERSDSPASLSIYPAPARQVRAEYEIGKPWTWIPLGTEPICAVAGGKELAGNYGVIYRILVMVRNPTVASRSVEVAFEAGAGPAAGVFMVGNRYVEVGNVPPSEERALARFTVGPKSSRSISIATFPLGGSAYPAKLIVR